MAKATQVRPEILRLRVEPLADDLEAADVVAGRGLPDDLGKPEEREQEADHDGARAPGRDDSDRRPDSDRRAHAASPEGRSFGEAAGARAAATIVRGRAPS